MEISAEEKKSKLFFVMKRKFLMTDPVHHFHNGVIFSPFFKFFLFIRKGRREKWFTHKMNKIGYTDECNNFLGYGGFLVFIKFFF